MTVRGLEPGRRVALLINECQNAMVNGEHSDNDGLVGEITGRNVLANIGALAGACRAAGALVVHSTIVLRPDGVGTTSSCLLLGALRKRGNCVEGHQGAEIHPDLTPRPEDYVSRRIHGLTPFHGTELEPVLRERGVRSVIVTGVSTNVGVPGTCLELLNRGLTAVVPENAIAGSSREIHDFQVANILPLIATVTTTADVLDALAAASQYA
ncbi:cysteine hydrolase [Amycolatopsis sp.]|uniref:cysteine hydrolase family protein n=1 Tax=Amycolatopsis sp. TaxID=37632 RepID=UPI002BFB5F75|nr:cysteine hydrolase [Amycolatopsis sp.]HVV12648.1 cysteine hydrolase [Amycolatopsis sp.]